MTKQQIKKFLKITLSGVLTGLIIGYLVGCVNGFERDFSLDSMLPCFMVTVTIIDIVILVFFSNIKGKIAKDNYSDEENSQFAKYEKTLLVTQSLSTMLVLTNICFISSIVLNFNLLGVFILNGALGAYLEVAHLNLVKAVQPSKNADPTTIDYNDQALATLDEGELYTLGKVALKTMNKMLFVYLGFIILGFFTAQNTMFFVGIWGIYIAQSIIMVYYSLKLGEFKA